jgi:hypothetical protein
VSEQPGDSGASIDPIPDAETIAPIGPIHRDQSTTVPIADEEAKVGPYDIFKVLVDAPGAKMLEARDAAGQQRLLQLVHVRAPRSEETTKDQLAYLKQIADRTEEAQNDPEVRVLAHGSVERSDGSQLLYWTLPWREGATRLGHAAAHIQSLAHLCAVAMSLVDRTRERHEKGLVDPLLTEDLVIIRPGAGASVAGVPIHIPGEWLTDDMLRARFAPEETLRKEPAKSGDLWRLGLTLRGIGKELGELPASMRRVFDALADPDPALRMASASEAASELQKLQGQFQASERQEAGLAPTPKPIDISMPEETWPEGKMVPINPKREEPQRELPLASMRSVLTADTGMVKMSEAQTMLDMRPPPEVRTKAATNLEAIRKRMEAFEGSPNDTLVDVDPPAFERYADAKIDDIGRASFPGGAALPSVKVKFLDPVEGPDSQETIDGPPPNAQQAKLNKSAWDRAKQRADARSAGFEIKGPMGPNNTLVGLRRIGPGGTLVGAKPIAKAVAAQLEAGTEIAAPPGRQLAAGSAPGVHIPQPPAHPQYVPPAQHIPQQHTPIEQRALLTSADAARARAEPPAIGAQPGKAGLPAATNQSWPNDVRALAPRGNVSMAAMSQEDEHKPPTLVGVPSLRFRGRDGAGEEAQVVYPIDPAQDPANAPTAKEPPASDPKPKSATGRLLLHSVMIAAASGLLTFAAVKILPRFREKPRIELVREITPLGDVSLETIPRDAIVVTEDDGRILGPAPLGFLVPAKTAIPVLITAKGFEPQRLLLPARGRVNVALLPLQETATPCEVELRIPPNVTLEAVGNPAAQLGPRSKIPGAVLARGVDGGGAWILLCPDLGGSLTQILPERIAPKSTTIDLLEPSPGVAYVEGEHIGKIPVKKTISSGFKVVRIELDGMSLERWVPIFTDTILRMPVPKK